MSLTNLQVVELQRAVTGHASHAEATETQVAAVVQAKIDEKVAGKLKKVAPSNPPAQVTCADCTGWTAEKKKYGHRDLTGISIWPFST